MRSLPLETRRMRPEASAVYTNPPKATGCCAPVGPTSGRDHSLRLVCRSTARKPLTPSCGNSLAVADGWPVRSEGLLLDAVLPAFATVPQVECRHVRLQVLEVHG